MSAYVLEARILQDGKTVGYIVNGEATTFGRYKHSAISKESFDEMVACNQIKDVVLSASNMLIGKNGFKVSEIEVIQLNSIKNTYKKVQELLRYIITNFCGQLMGLGDYLSCSKYQLYWRKDCYSMVCFDATITNPVKSLNKVKIEYGARYSGYARGEVTIDLTQSREHNLAKLAKFIKDNAAGDVVIYYDRLMKVLK